MEDSIRNLHNSLENLSTAVKPKEVVTGLNVRENINSFISHVKGSQAQPRHRSTTVSEDLQPSGGMRSITEQLALLCQEYHAKDRERTLMLQRKSTIMDNACKILELKSSKGLFCPLEERLNIDAASLTGNESQNLNESQDDLSHECVICTENIQLKNSVPSIYCTCALCEYCFKKHFTVCIKEKNVDQFLCPGCEPPDDIDMQLHLMVLEKQVERFLPDLKKLFDQKLLEFGLKASGDFRYCSHDASLIGNESQNLDESQDNLSHECVICTENIQLKNSVQSIYCKCALCEDCFKQHFRVCIKEKNGNQFLCPGCEPPDDIDMQLHLILLGIQVKQFLPNLKKLFDKKILELGLKAIGDFRYCSHCSKGFCFIYDGVPKMKCPHCKQISCYSCNEMWMEEHNEKSCEEYQEWKSSQNNEDPLIFLQNLAIDCPQCNNRFQLIRGGCMHFTCTQCGCEFCSDCTSKFLRSDSCDKYQRCETMGLHCHHPRNCFAILRDFEISDLKKLLQDNNVEIREVLEDKKQDRCLLMVQNEPDKEIHCGNDVLNLNLCRKHYREYLVKLINKNNLDVVDLMDEDKLRLEFINHELEVPENIPEGQKTAEYLRKEISRQHPLHKIKIIKF